MGWVLCGDWWGDGSIFFEMKVWENLRKWRPAECWGSLTQGRAGLGCTGPPCQESRGGLPDFWAIQLTSAFQAIIQDFTERINIVVHGSRAGKDWLQHNKDSDLQDTLDPMTSKTLPSEQNLSHVIVDLFIRSYLLNSMRVEKPIFKPQITFWQEPINWYHSIMPYTMCLESHLITLIGP